MVELSLVVAIVLFAVGAIFSLPNASSPYSTFVTRVGLCFFVFAFLWPLLDKAA